MAVLSAIAVPPPYANPAVYRVNKVNPHARVIPSENPDYRRILRQGWRFKHVQRVADIPRGFADRATPLSHWQAVSVPSLWQEPGVGCYAYDFRLPAGWQGRRTFVKIGAASTAVHLYVNGQLVGYSEDSFTPAEWDITHYLAEGTNRLALRVYSQSDGGDIENHGIHPQYGLLREIELYSLPPVHIIDYNLIATLDTSDNQTGLLDITIDLSTEVRRPYRVELDIIDTSVHPVRRILHRQRRLDIQDWFVSFGQKDNAIGPVRPWSPAQPFCYQLVIRLLDDQGLLLHAVSAGIGFRMLAIRDKVWTLNGQPLQIRGIEWQEPPASPESVLQTLVEMRQRGINAIRLQRPASETFYDLCDRLGIMVWDCCGLAIPPAQADAIANNEAWDEALIYRAHNLFRRDRAHPCVIMWGISDAYPWGSGAQQVIKYLRDRDAVRIACHPRDRHSPLRLLDNPSVYSLECEAAATPRYKAPVIAFYAPASRPVKDLLECWDTIARHPHLHGAFFGPWDSLTASQRRALQNAFATWAPQEVAFDGEPPVAEAPKVELPVKKEVIQEAEMPRRPFFLIRWIRALFRR